MNHVHEVIRWRVVLFAAMCCVSGTYILRADDEATREKDGDGDKNVLAFDTFDYPLGALRDAADGRGWKGPWKTSRSAPPVVDAASRAAGREPSSSPCGLLLQGDSQRNNPIRRELNEGLSRETVFVRFDLHYQSVASANSAEVDPEFFVLWLDRLDGGDRATHASNTPNIGLHFADRGLR